MRKLFNAIAIISLAFSAGCYETNQEFFINPDGSGKVILEAKFKGGMFSMGDDNADPKEKAKKAAAGVISDSDGILTWKDVSYDLLDDGRTYFKGTAYFKDISKLKFQNLGDEKVTLKKTTKGSLMLDIEMGSKDEKDEDEDAPAAPAMTDAEIKAKIAAQRAEFNQSKTMMAGFLGSMKTDMTFHMPGTLKGGSNMKKTKEGALKFGFSGMDMLNAMEKLMADDEFMKEQIKAGKNPAKDSPSDPYILNEKMFGKKGPIRAVFAPPLKPLFDFKAESDAAKKDFAKVSKLLDAAPVVETLQGDPIEGTQVAGVRLVKFSDNDNELRPFNYDKGYWLIIAAAMPESVFAIEGAKVTEAVTDTGKSILPKEEWDRKAHWPKLSKDKKTAMLELKLNVPDENAKGLKVLAGEIEYHVASGTKEVNLGITSFTAGTEGTECGAKVDTVGKASWGDGFVMSIVFKLDKNAIKEVRIMDAEGNPIKVEDGGSSWGGNTTTLTFSSKTKFPEKGSIVAELYDNQKKVKVPFKLENISLLGNPMK